MLIESITVENFRSFSTQTAITELDRINVFIGPNGSGKTNVIEALYFFKRLWKKEYDPDYPNYIKECVFDHQYDKSISIELVLSTSDQEREEIFEYFLSVNPELEYLNEDIDFLKKIKYSIKINNEKIVSELLAVSNFGKLIKVVERNVTEDAPYQYSLKLEKVLAEVDSLNTLSTRELVVDPTLWIPSHLILDCLTDIFECKIAEIVRKFIMQFHWYFADRRIDHKSKDIFDFLFGDGHNIKGHIIYLKQNDYSSFLELKKIANYYLGIEDIEVDEFNDIKVKRSGLASLFDLTSISAGEVQLLILLDSIIIHKAGNIYFVEEPEVHVHSETQKNLLKLFLDKSKGSQFFITTHSPNFAKLDGSVKNYSVTKYEGQTRVEPINSAEQIQTIKDQMGIDNLDTLQFNSVLFVEGESEAEAFKIMGELPQFSALKFVRIIPYKGDGNTNNLIKFNEYAQSLGYAAIIIGDEHDNIKLASQQESNWRIYFKVRNNQFEDQFDSAFLVRAMNAVYNDPNVFDMSVKELQLSRDKGQEDVAHILDYYLQRTSRKRLEKRELAKRLAGIIVSEIVSKKPRQRQSFEDEVNEIMAHIK